MTNNSKSKLKNNNNTETACLSLIGFVLDEHLYKSVKYSLIHLKY